MDFKIAMPNPNDGTPKEFFAQMKIVLKACEKAYQEMTKDLTEEEINDENLSPYVAFRFPTLEDKLDEIDPDMVGRSDIQLGVFEL